MLHPSNIKQYIPVLKSCSEKEAEKLLNEIANFFYDLGIEDEKERPWPDK
jgi:hypothetical protein